jgi:hypothetical protein
MKKMNLERQWRNLVGDSDDKEIFEGFEPVDIYVDKTFDTNTKNTQMNLSRTRIMTYKDIPRYDQLTMTI